MIKSVIQRLLVRYPKVESFTAPFAFRYHMIRRKPYWGSYMSSHQVWPERAPFMRKLIKKICFEQGQLLILEVGSWAGSSAILWAETAKEAFRSYGKRPDITIVCVDPWDLYSSLKTRSGRWVTAMIEAAREDNVFPLFLNNVKWSGQSDVIIPMRTSSHTAAKLFRDKLFGMVFVDGDHAYSAVRRDIADYAPLIRDGGYLCGDDLELQMSEVDQNVAWSHAEFDFTRDPKSGKQYHPGVTLAVGESFGEVSCYSGFWIMQKAGDSWKKVTL